MLTLISCRVASASGKENDRKSNFPREESSCDRDKRNRPEPSQLDAEAPRIAVPPTWCLQSPGLAGLQRLQEQRHQLRVVGLVDLQRSTTSLNHPAANYFTSTATGSTIQPSPPACKDEFRENAIAPHHLGARGRECPQLRSYEWQDSDLHTANWAHLMTTS